MIENEDSTRRFNIFVIGKKTVKTNNRKINWNINPNIKHRIQNKLQDVKNKNMKCVNKSLLW
jgi:hypothetical protein